MSVNHGFIVIESCSVAEFQTSGIAVQPPVALCISPHYR